MFGWLKEQRKELEEAILRIKQDHKHAINQLDELQDLVRQEQFRLSEVRKDFVVDRLAKLTKYSCAVDWDRMNAFSIERAYPKSEDFVHATVIGYLKADGTIGEWILWTDEETHNKLVEEFKQTTRK